jgi:two-component system, NarL family, response regulator DevR
MRVVIADDHALYREGLARLLRKFDIEVVGEAPDGEAAVRIVERTAPDVVLLDLRMPGVSGLEATRRLSDRAVPSPVIVLSVSAEESDVTEAIAAGASGYVLKRIGSGELVDAVRTVAAGRSLLDPEVTAQVLARLRNASQVEEAGAFSELTEQERRVLAHLAQGRSNRVIAAEMGLAEKTVRNYVSSILAKLSLASRSQAVAYAIRKRLPELSEEE